MRHLGGEDIHVSWKFKWLWG